ncbi:hypothetical protein ACRAWD_29800 [Caulobacter segnis]
MRKDLEQVFATLRVGSASELARTVSASPCAPRLRCWATTRWKPWGAWTLGPNPLRPAALRADGTRIARSGLWPGRRSSRAGRPFQHDLAAAPSAWGGPGAGRGLPGVLLPVDLAAASA